MKKIIGNLSPTELQQKIFVYENGNKIDMCSAAIEDISKAVLTLAEKYEITELNLVGPKVYTSHIGEIIQKAEMDKYSCNKLEIKYL